MSRVIASFAQFFDGEGNPLSNGWLRFLVTDTNNTEKDTYADLNQTIPNANPLQLDAEGRCPNVFGQGYYKVILYQHNPITGLPGAVVQTVDPVISDFTATADSTIGNFAEWDSNITYQVSQIVIFNTKYYRSIGGGNFNNQPDTNPDQWEEITFLRFWNTNVTYLNDDVVVYSGGLYFSIQNANTGNQPDITPLWWSPVGSGTVLLNWQEAGTTLRPVVTGYDLGASGNIIGTLWANNLGKFPLTPASPPVNDYDIANKKYIDDLDILNMKWEGVWSPGTYNPFDVVTDDQWLMIANTTTTERPAPQPVGESLWVRDLFTPPALLETSITESVMYIGQRYTFTTATTVRSMRIYLPALAVGLNLEVWAVIDPGGANQRIENILPGFNVTAKDTDLWVEVSIGNYYIDNGATIDLIMVFRSSTGGTSFTYEWDYIRANGDPLPGDIHHQSGGNIDEIRVHEQDTSLVDRTTDLDNIGPGSTLLMVDSVYQWEVISASKTGDVYTFIVDPGVRAGNDTSNFTFTYYGTLPIYYAYNTNLYSGDARIQGFFGNEYLPNDVTKINENGYGIDIKAQAMASSTDWEVMARPSGASGGTSSDALTLQGYTPEEFAVLAENETITGQWDFTGDTPTINSNIVYSAENGPISGHRNAVINGDFQVWQRGSSFSSSAYIATADKWVTSGSGQTVTSTRTAFTPGQTDVPGNPKYYYRFAISSSEDNWYLGQLIEGVDTYAGEEVTLSAYIRSDNSKNITLGLQQRFGTGGSSAVSHNDTKTTTTGWVRYTFTTTLTSMSGKTIGTDDCLLLTFQAPTALTGYYDIARVRLEPGPVATTPEDIKVEKVLSICQRYYQKSWKWDIDPGSSTSVPDTFSAGLTNSAYGVSSFHILPVVMYREPDLTYWDNEGNVSRVRLGGTPNTAITDGAAQASDAWIGFDFTISPYVNNKVALHYELDADIPLI